MIQETEERVRLRGHLYGYFHRHNLPRPLSADLVAPAIHFGRVVLPQSTPSFARIWCSQPLKQKSLMTTIQLLEMIQSALMTDAVVTLDDTRTSIADWDSVGHLSVISSLEASLGADAIGEEIQQAASVRQIADALQKAGLLKD